MTNCFIQILGLVGVLAAVGCGTSQSLRTQATPAMRASTQQVKVGVAMYRQVPVAVPIPPQGATLRSVMADAKDLVSRGGGIGEAFILNDVSTFAKGAGLVESDVKSILEQSEMSGPIFAGEELVVLQRQNLLLFIPGFMILDTAAGSVRVMPGDSVATLPLTSLADLGDPLPPMPQAAVGTASRVQTPRISVTFGGDYFDEMDLDINGGRTVGKLLDFEGWKTDLGIVKPLPVLDLNQLHPNAAVLYRESGNGIARLAILPPLITLDKVQLPGTQLNTTQLSSGQQKELQNDFGSGLSRTQFLNLTLRDGDQVTLTRLERIPLIAAGLAAPVASPASPVPVVNRVEAPRRHIFPRFHGHAAQ